MGDSNVGEAANGSYAYFRDRQPQPKPVDLDYEPGRTEMCNVTVRMPVVLRDAVQRRAARDMRPMAQAIRYALSLYVEAGRLITPDIPPDLTAAQAPSPTEEPCIRPNARRRSRSRPRARSSVVRDAGAHAHLRPQGVRGLRECIHKAALYPIGYLDQEAGQSTNAIELRQPNPQAASYMGSAGGATPVLWIYGSSQPVDVAAVGDVRVGERRVGWKLDVVGVPDVPGIVAPVVVNSDVGRLID